MTKNELRGMMAGAIYARFAGGASDDADDMAATLSLDFADAVLSALRDAGLAIVPKEPSEAMQYAGSDGPMKLPERGEDALPVTANIYRAMLSAGDLLGERGS